MMFFKILKPCSEQIAILDDFHNDVFDILKKKNENYLVIPIRKKIPVVLNFSFFKEILILCFECKFSVAKIRKFYLETLFNYLPITKVFTFFENTQRVSNLKKKFPKILFYTFVNGTRVPSYNYKHDHLLTWGSLFEKIDKKKRFKSNTYHSVGSLRLLNYLFRRKATKNQKYDIIYISTFSAKKSNSVLSKWSNLIMIYQNVLLENLLLLQKKNKYNLKILMKSTVNDPDYTNEYRFYQNFFLKKDILIKKNYLDSYKYIDKSRVTISIASALGLEALCLNTKVLLGFSIKDLILKSKTIHDCFLPYSKYLCEDFCLNDLSYKELNNKIANLLNMQKVFYTKKTYMMRRFYSVKPNLNKIKKIIYAN